MQTEKLDLLDELPEHRDTIQALRARNAHFARMFDEYHEINSRIQRIEADIEPASDFYLEDKKKRRLKLKDQLYQMIQAI